MQKNITLITIKPSKADQSEFAKKADTDKINDWLEKHAQSYDNIVLLSITAKSMPTEDWVRSFPLWKKVCFIIWWPHWLEEERLSISNYKLSIIGLGKHTMVHWLAKLVLLEQLYRVRMIGNNRKYNY